MLEIIALIGVLIISLIIVIKSADVFVDNLVEIGGALGISQIILGVTASAIGTSLPEFGSAVIASLSGSTELGVGTVIGSNIWNMAGILGISAVVAGSIRTGSEGLTRDWLMTLGTGLILLFFMLFGDITWTAAVVMIAAYCFYLWFLIKAQRKHSDEEGQEKEKESQNIDETPEKLEKNSEKAINKKSIAFVIVGFVGLVIGCRLMVYSGVELASIAGIPAMIMGLFTLAIGTSIPELVVTLSSATKGLHDLSIGTVLGSNTFNILIGIGVPALFMSVPVERLSLTFDAPVMIFVTILLFVLVRKSNMKLNRVAGIILLVTYIVYAFLRIFVLA
ncbi:calcium/sodium antiporter [Methanobacterium petrolearium]|uniref:calcium/sodium antiporter n=1 Tax=Methanobacterium petrolearium TaxID=710190 RepID=UPI001AE7F4F0|nr:calcium/sodium antiporter [Methanobacterium petrolearium]MBP1945802.1 cation:H+ antiporter [Methanobacterium petrolearium]BDZ69652.1 cation transporter [Methanobacterium petrolearium]